MSYEITYRKAVVKLTDGRTIGIIESGSNNCTEIYSNRRARSRGFNSGMVGTKATVKAYVKSWIQRYIDDEKENDINEDNWTEKNSKWYASWKFPGGTLGSAISYLTNPNIDLDIADKYITISLQADETHTKYKPSEIDTPLKLLNGNVGRFNASGVDNAIYYQKERNRLIKESKPKITKEPGNFIVRIRGDTFPYKLTSRHLQYTSRPKSSKRFDTEKQARKWMDEKVLPRFSNKINEYEVLTIQQYEEEK